MPRSFTLTTPRELMKKGLWDKYCEMSGTNPWAVNEGLMDSYEGLMDSYEDIELSHTQATAIGMKVSAFHDF